MMTIACQHVGIWDQLVFSLYESSYRLCSLMESIVSMQYPVSDPKFLPKTDSNQNEERNVYITEPYLGFSKKHTHHQLTNCVSVNVLSLFRNSFCW